MSKLQADLAADIVRVDLAFLSGTGAVLTVTLRVDGLPDVQIDVLPDDTVLDTVQEAVGFKPQRILLGSRPVEGGTFDDAGIEDLATLTVLGQRVATAVEVVDKLMELNPGVTRDRLTKYRLKLEEDGVTVKCWNLSQLGLVEVPEEICDLKFTGYLSLHSNKIVSLPQRIGEMRIGSNLDLSDNQISTVPPSMAQITVGGTLSLIGNPMGTTLPACLRGTGMNVRMQY